MKPNILKIAALIAAFNIHSISFAAGDPAMDDGSGGEETTVVHRNDPAIHGDEEISGKLSKLTLEVEITSNENVSLETGRKLTEEEVKDDKIPSMSESRQTNELIHFNFDPNRADEIEERVGTKIDDLFKLSRSAQGELKEIKIIVPRAYLPLADQIKKNLEENFGIKTNVYVRTLTRRLMQWRQERKPEPNETEIAHADILTALSLTLGSYGWLHSGISTDRALGLIALQTVITYIFTYQMEYCSRFVCDASMKISSKLPAKSPRWVKRIPDVLIRLGAHTGWTFLFADIRGAKPPMASVSTYAGVAQTTANAFATGIGSLCNLSVQDQCFSDRSVKSWGNFLPSVLIQLIGMYDLMGYGSHWFDINIPFTHQVLLPVTNSLATVFAVNLVYVGLIAKYPNWFRDRIYTPVNKRGDKFVKAVMAIDNHSIEYLREYGLRPCQDLLSSLYEKVFIPHPSERPSSNFKDDLLKD